VRYRESRFFDLVTGLHPSGKVSAKRKKNIAFCRFAARFLLTTLAGKCSHIGSYSRTPYLEGVKGE